MSEIKLKSCPFCGGEAITMGAFSISRDCYIMCETCGALIEKEVAWNGMTQEQHDEECKKILAEAWNTRKPVEMILERLEERRIIYETYVKPIFPKGDTVSKELEKAIEIIKEEVG